MRSTELLRSKDRISSLDVFRALAILPVVIYHFNGFLPFGYLGVDLFFVISGLLVGSILVRKFKKDEKINFWRFFLQRGFKIWPSYYWFLGFGSLLGWMLYAESRPDYIISGGKDMLRYVFFCQNYTGQPFHWPFDHVWSLCVEEHFYILLPLMLIALMGLSGNNKRMLILSAVLLIISGIVFKYISYNFTSNTDTYSRTQNRIDALGWGVLLGILVTYYESRLRNFKRLPLVTLAGIIFFTADILVYIYWKNSSFNNIFFHSAAPFSFFLMLLGAYYLDFSAWKPLRFIAYYSYNWYLWHPLFVLVCSKFFGITLWGLLLYLVISFLTAMIFTILIEESFLSRREAILARIFKQEKSTTKSAA